MESMKKITISRKNTKNLYRAQRSQVYLMATNQYLLSLTGSESAFIQGKGGKNIPLSACWKSYTNKTTILENIIS